MSPSSKTFGIPELLEMILEYATPQDVLLWQRVNKTWHAIIQKSTLLQEKLYFRIKPCKNVTEQHDAIWNPFTELLFARDSRDYSPYMFRLPIGNDAFSGKANYPTASWKRMLMTSPATTWMRVYKLYEKSSCDCSVACESGVTIGKLAETVEGLNVNYAGYEKGGLAGLVRKFGYPDEDEYCT